MNNSSNTNAREERDTLRLRLKAAIAIKALQGIETINEIDQAGELAPTKGKVPPIILEGT